MSLQVEIEGTVIPVTVDDEGIFHAEFLGEEYESPSFSTMRSNLRDAHRAQRAEVPFVNRNGVRGVMRGWHGSQHKLLVTWEDSEKDSISPHEKIFTELDEVTRAELLQLVSQARDVRNRRNEIEHNTVTAKDVFLEALDADLEAWSMQRKKEQA